MTFYPPVVEEHDGIAVVREDLCCPDLPSGKLRGVVPWFCELRDIGVRGVVNHATSHSNSHAIVAYAARAAGIGAVSITNCGKPTPQTAYAERLGGRVVYLGKMRLNVLHARAREYTAEPGYRHLPWALGSWDALRHVSVLVGQVPGQYTHHVVAVGGGGYVAAVARGLKDIGSQSVVYGVATSGSLKSNHRRLGAVRPVHHVTVVEPDCDPGETPFPSDPTYEWIAWPVACRFRDAGHSVCFWSVGSRIV